MAEPTEVLLNKPTIVNWALAELGLSPKFSIDNATGLGAMVDIFWTRAVGRCFGLHDWTFCRITHQLTRQAAAPVNGYAYGFDLPGGILGEPVRYLNAPPRHCREPVRDTRIEGRTVFADEAQLWTVSKVPVDPQYWDPQFADCFAVALASYLAVPMTQDLDLKDRKEKQAFGDPREGGAGGMFGRLIAQNMAAHPVGANLLANDPLTAGRSAGGHWYGRHG